MLRNGHPRVLRLVLAVILLVVASACGSSEGEGSGSDGPSDDPGPARSGGSITWLRQGEIDSLDPIHILNAGQHDGAIALPIFDALVYIQDGEIAYGTAESLTSDDAVVWTLKLKPDIRFSDGTAYDAEAVKFNYERLQDPSNNAQRGNEARQISEMAVIDPLTLEITLAEKSASFPFTMALIPYIGSPTAIEADESGFGRSPVGAGPFILTEWSVDNQKVLERNPDYYKPDLPHLDSLTFRIVSDDAQRVNSLCTGEAHLIDLPNFDLVQEADQRGCGQVIPSLELGGMMILFNVREAPFDDPRARQAIAQAIDLEDYSMVLFNGEVPASTGPFPPGSPFFSEDTEQPAHDPDAAQDLLDELFAENGEPLRLTIPTINTNQYMRWSEYIQGVLSPYDNLEVTLEPNASATQVERVFAGDFNIAFFGLGITYPDPAWTRLFVCESQITGYCNEDFDRLIAESRQELDTERRVELVQEAHSLVVADLPVFWVQPRTSWAVASADLRGHGWVGSETVLTELLWLDQ